LTVTGLAADQAALVMEGRKDVFAHALHRAGRLYIHIGVRQSLPLSFDRLTKLSNNER
jgi:hypothetical protein